jgi:hypothetical protein
MDLSRSAVRAVTKQSLLCLAGGFLIELLGGVCFVFNAPSLVKMLAVYPGSAIFYLIPRSVTNRLSETTLFFLGFVSGAIVWTGVLCVILVLGKALYVRLSTGMVR